MNNVDVLFFFREDRREDGSGDYPKNRISLYSYLSRILKKQDKAGDSIQRLRINSFNFLNQLSKEVMVALYEGIVYEILRVPPQNYMSDKNFWNDIPNKMELEIKDVYSVVKRVVEDNYGPTIANKREAETNLWVFLGELVGFYKSGRQMWDKENKPVLNLEYALQNTSNVLDFFHVINAKVLFNVGDDKKSIQKIINKYRDSFEEKNYKDYLKNLFENPNIWPLLDSEDNVTAYILNKIDYVLNQKNAYLSFNKNMNIMGYDLIKNMRTYATDWTQYLNLDNLEKVEHEIFRPNGDWVVKFDVLKMEVLGVLCLNGLNVLTKDNTEKHLLKRFSRLPNPSSLSVKKREESLLVWQKMIYDGFDEVNAKVAKKIVRFNVDFMDNRRYVVFYFKNPTEQEIESVRKVLLTCMEEIMYRSVYDTTDTIKIMLDDYILREDLKDISPMVENSSNHRKSSKF